MSSCVILGLWPLAGITTLDVDDASSVATIQAAIEAGVDAFDTAYSYGYDGESDRLLGRVLRQFKHSPDRLKVIGKVGQRWTQVRLRIVDSSPNQLVADAEESLVRLGIEHFDVLMLHSIDPNVELQRSAEALESMRRRGLAKRIGVCNVDEDQLAMFSSVSECAVIQCPLNMLQPQSLIDPIRYAAKVNIEVHVYWTLMKGLLAGKISRDHVFAPGDSRPKYEIYQGPARDHAHRVIAGLESIAKQHDTTVARLSIGWALSQPGVTAALVGAKRPNQIQETALARPLDQDVLTAMDVVMAETTN